MKQWENIPLQERELIIKSDIYALLTTTSPSYWCKKGYLKQGLVHTPKGDRIKYEMLQKKRLKLLKIPSLEEKKFNILYFLQKRNFKKSNLKTNH